MPARSRSAAEPDRGRSRDRAAALRHAGLRGACLLQTARRGLRRARIAGKYFILIFVVGDFRLDQLLDVVRHRWRGFEHHLKFVGMQPQGLPPVILCLEEGPRVGSRNALLCGVLIGIAAAKAADGQHYGEDADINSDELVAAPGILAIHVAAQLLPCHAQMPPGWRLPTARQMMRSSGAAAKERGGNRSLRSMARPSAPSRYKIGAPVASSRCRISSPERPSRIITRARKELP